MIEKKFTSDISVKSGMGSVSFSVESVTDMESMPAVESLVDVDSDVDVDALKLGLLHQGVVAVATELDSPPRVQKVQINRWTRDNKVDSTSIDFTFKVKFKTNFYSLFIMFF